MSRTAPLPRSSITPTPHQRLLPESRLSTTNEPPAEEAHEAPDGDNDGHRYACYGTRTKVEAFAGLNIAGDNTISVGWFFAAYAVLHSLNITARLRALHTLASKSLVVPREALSTSACTPLTFRTPLGTRRAVATSRILSIGTRGTLPIIPCLCAHRFPRERLCVVAPAGL